MKQTTLRERCAAHAACSQLNQVYKEIAELDRCAFDIALSNPAELERRIERLRDEVFDVLYDAASIMRYENARRNPTQLKIVDEDEADDTHDTGNPVGELFAGIAVPTISANLIGSPVPQSDRVGG